jgi:predicted lipid-binding transport protein (Tim44 family)
VLGQVRGSVDDEAGGVMDQAIPELGDWSKAADQVAAAPAEEDDGAGGFLGGLLGSAAGNKLIGAVAGEEAQETAQMVSMLSKLGIEPSKAMMAAPLVKQFLEERLPGDWGQRILKAAPALLGIEEEEEEPSMAKELASGLGSFFK